jgi:iron complex transport system substrate-binding protein
LRRSIGRANQLTKLQQTWKSNPIARSLKASKAGKVYFIIPSYLCLALPGPIGTNLYLEALKKQLLLTKAVAIEP